jgi:hypothetical protein
LIQIEVQIPVQLRTSNDIVFNNYCLTKLRHGPIYCVYIGSL